MNLNMRVVGADAVAKSLALAAATIDLKIDRQLRQWGFALETKVKAHASGRPGPRAITGDYRRSITTEYGTWRGSKAAIVGTASPQGRRLEYGFNGLSDSLGRVFHQPPYPHFRPAADEIDGPFTAAMAKQADIP